MGDDIGLGLSSMAFCFDFCSTHVMQLSNGNAYFYWFQLRAESMHCLVAPTKWHNQGFFLFESKPMWWV